MKFPPNLALLLCFAVTGAGAASTSISISMDNSVSRSNTSISTHSSGSTSGDTDANVFTSTTSGTDSVGSAIGRTACGMNSQGRRCEVTCSAPKVARCVKPSAERMPRCGCR